MASRLPLKKIETEKAEFIEYLKRYSTEPAISSKFPYKSFYENDPEVQKVRAEVANKVIDKQKSIDVDITPMVVVSNHVATTMHKSAKQIKQNSKVEKEKILHKIGEMQSQLKTKDKINITQELLDDYKLYIGKIPSTYQIELHDKIKKIEKKIEDVQVVLNARPYIIKLMHLNTIDTDEDFYKELGTVQRAAHLSELSDVEKDCINRQIVETIRVRINKTLGKSKHIDDKLFDNILENVNHVIKSFDISDLDRTSLTLQLDSVVKKVKEKIYAQKYFEFSVYIKDWLRKIEDSDKTIQARRIRLNDVDKEIRMSGFDKADLLSLQKAVSTVRKRLTLIEQGEIIDNPVSIKKQSKEVLLQKVQQQNIPEEPREIAILWCNIVFGNNVIRITDENGKFLLAPKETCRKSYNQIKEYLADKLPQIILVKNQSGVWMLKEPIVFKRALNMIRKKESDDLLQEALYKKALHSFSSMESYLINKQNQELILKRLREKKQNYLNHLIKNQLQDYKLVPAVEMIAHESAESAGEEDVFIFTIPTSNSYYRSLDCVNIVYENVNPARASIVFTVEKRYYNQALQSIFNFMNDARQKNKRSRLRQVASLNNYIKKLHVVNHSDDMHLWAVAIKR